jgi:hypothetical protein
MQLETDVIAGGLSPSPVPIVVVVVYRRATAHRVIAVAVGLTRSLLSPSSSYPVAHRDFAIIVNFVARRAVAIDVIIVIVCRHCPCHRCCIPSPVAPLPFVVIVVDVAPSSLPSSSLSRHRRPSPSSSSSYPVAPPDQHGIVVFGCSLKRT